MAIGKGESLHADCAVFLWPLSPWQPQCIVGSLAQVASLFYHIRALVGVDLGGPMTLTHHDTHVVTDTVSGSHETLTLFILLCSQLQFCGVTRQSRDSHVILCDNTLAN